jgi:hypothetical protein
VKWIILFVTMSSAFAQGLKMKPGVWSIDMKVKGKDGKEMDPVAKIQEALAKIPESQRKKMMEMMGEVGSASLKPKGMEVCFTEQMIKDPSSLASQANMERKCETKITSQTEKEVKMNISCKDGTKGNAHFKIPQETTYSGVIDMESPERGKNSLTLNGKFLHSMCKKETKKN